MSWRAAMKRASRKRRRPFPVRSSVSSSSSFPLQLFVSLRAPSCRAQQGWEYENNFSAQGGSTAGRQFSPLRGISRRETISNFQIEGGGRCPHISFTSVSDASFHICGDRLL